ncbi:unnamed protein product, partial [Amoebophrya sp. A120]
VHGAVVNYASCRSSDERTTVVSDAAKVEVGGRTCKKPRKNVETILNANNKNNNEQSIGFFNTTANTTTRASTTTAWRQASNQRRMKKRQRSGYCAD